jgi:hypothetical protein
LGKLPFLAERHCSAPILQLIFCGENSMVKIQLTQKPLFIYSKYKKTRFLSAGKGFGHEEHRVFGEASIFEIKDLMINPRTGKLHAVIDNRMK